METVFSTLKMFVVLLAFCIFVFGIAFLSTPAPVTQDEYEVML